MAKLSKKAKKRGNVRERILFSIINYMEKFDGRSPTLREIGDDVGIQSLGHISHHLNGLEETYYIQRDDHKSRSIKVLKNWNGSSLTNARAIAAGPKRTIIRASVG